MQLVQVFVDSQNADTQNSANSVKFQFSLDVEAEFTEDIKICAVDLMPSVSADLSVALVF